MSLDPMAAPGSPLPSKHLWRPGIFRRAPWLALSALLLAILLAIASLVVIMVSDGQAAEWIWQPSVILSIMGTITTAMLLFGLSRGVVITWWRASMKGCTLKQLHSIWNYGGSGSQTAAWMSGMNANKVAIASVLTTIAGIAYGPLLQKASRTESRIMTSLTERYFPIATVLPDSYVGYRSNGTAAVLPRFAGVVQNWFSGIAPLTLNNYDVSGCLGSCHLNVSSVGLSITTQVVRTPFNLRALASAAGGMTAFSISFSRFDNGSTPVLLLTVGYTEDVDINCTGVYVTKTHELRAGSYSYPVLITNRTISTDRTSDGYSPDFTAHSYAGDSPNVANGSPIGPLSGLHYVGDEYYASSATTFYTASTGVFQRLYSGSMAAQHFDNAYAKGQCLQRFKDPSSAILSSMAEILFFASVDVMNAGGGGTGLNPLVPALLSTQSAVYVSQYGFAIGAIIVLVIALASIGWCLWGWWELGRHVSLSPLETARALGAPIFMDGDVPAEAEGIVQSLGEKRVQYGEALIGDELVNARCMLLFGEMEGDSIWGGDTPRTSKEKDAESWIGGERTSNDDVLLTVGPRSRDNDGRWYEGKAF